MLTGPVPLPGGLSVAHLAALVAADVLVRRARAAGDELRWVASAFAGGLTTQRAAEDDLVREGLDKAMIGREAFAARMAASTEAARADLADAASALRLGFDVGAAVEAGDAAAHAARTAFVCLFDAGVVHRADRVVGACPGCATTIGASEAVPAHLEGEDLTLRLALVDDLDGDGHLDVACLATELLPGVVAIAVPEGSPAAGRCALVPLAASMVPVVADAGVARNTLVVPAHDQAAFELARRLGLPAVPVLDDRGFVCAPGPLVGQARYAARVAARRLLDAERVVLATADGLEAVERCPACRTVLVPLLGTHWVLALADLETAAADAVRDGRLTVWPAGAREDLLAGAGEAGEWCLSQQVWGGVAVPVGRCLDCGHLDVSVHPATSCGRCMGTLVADVDVLEERFVRCMLPLAVAGWPEAGRGPAERTGGSVLFVVPAAAAADVLPMVALGLRLDGAVPFDEVAVLCPPNGAVDGDAGLDLPALAVEEGAATLRIALASGGLDLVAARDVVALLEKPPPGHADVRRLASAMDAASAVAPPSFALGLLAAAAREGVPTADVAKLRALAAPFVGR